MNKLALERIYRLYELAEKEFSKNPERSKRYMEIAKEIGKTTRTKIPQEIKKKFCRKCNSLKVKKLEEKEMILVQCLECGARKRYPLRETKKEKENAKVREKEKKKLKGKGISEKGK